MLSKGLTAVVFAGALACSGASAKQAGEVCVASSECGAGLVCDYGQNPHVCASQVSVDAREIDAPIDAVEIDAPQVDAGVVDAAIDARVIDAAVIDAAVDAPIDAVEIDAPVDAGPDA